MPTTARKPTFARVDLSRRGGEAGIRRTLQRPPDYWDAVATCLVRQPTGADLWSAVPADELPGAAAIELPAETMRRLSALDGSRLRMILVGGVEPAKSPSKEVAPA